MHLACGAVQQASGRNLWLGCWSQMVQRQSILCLCHLLQVSLQSTYALASQQDVMGIHSSFKGALQSRRPAARQGQHWAWAAAGQSRQPVAGLRKAAALQGAVPPSPPSLPMLLPRGLLRKVSPPALHRRQSRAPPAVVSGLPNPALDAAAAQQPAPQGTSAGGS